MENNNTDATKLMITDYLTAYHLGRENMIDAIRQSLEAQLYLTTLRGIYLTFRQDELINPDAATLDLIRKTCDEVDAVKSYLEQCLLEAQRLQKNCDYFRDMLKTLKVDVEALYE